MKKSLPFSIKHLQTWNGVSIHTIHYKLYLIPIDIPGLEFKFKDVAFSVHASREATTTDWSASKISCMVNGTTLLYVETPPLTKSFISLTQKHCSCVLCSTGVLIFNLYRSRVPFAIQAELPAVGMPSDSFAIHFVDLPYVYTTIATTHYSKCICKRTMPTILLGSA